MIGEGRGKKSLLLLMLLAFMTTTGFQIHRVFADVPSVLSLDPWTSGTDTLLNITVRHSSPTSSYYVNKVEVDVDGTVQDINLPSQSTVNFVVQFNMGSLAEEPTVRARAHCSTHGWSNWSNSAQVPEFPLIQLIAISAIVSIAVLLLAFMVYRSKKKTI